MSENKPMTPPGLPPYHVSGRKDPLDPARLEEWALPEEEHVLERVRYQLHSSYFSGAEPSTLFRSPSRKVWYWGAAFTAAAACMVWIGLNLSLFSNPLQFEYKGAIQKVATTQPSLQEPTQLTVASKKKGRVSVPDKWEVFAYSDTSMTLGPASPKQRVKLHKGFIGVHVVPKQMKSFVVEVNNVKVRVKGTRFSVERTPQWLRVEVQRGRVEVQTAQDSRYFLSKGQGLRWAWKSMKAEEYKLPPQKASLGARWRWIATKQGVKAMVAYLNDMLQSQRFSVTDKVEHLADAANWARRKGATRTAFAFKWRAYQLAPSGEGSDLRLFQAVKLCREAWAEHAPHCVTLIHRFLRRYPKAEPIYLEAVHLWKARAEAARAKTAGAFRRHLRRYLRKYRRSGNVATVRRWLRLSYQRSPVLLCREFGWTNRSSLPQRSWLLRRCASK